MNSYRLLLKEHAATLAAVMLSEIVNLSQHCCAVDTRKRLNLSDQLSDSHYFLIEVLEKTSWTDSDPRKSYYLL